MMRTVADLSRISKISWQSLLGIVIADTFALLLVGTEQKRKHTVFIFKISSFAKHILK